MHPKWDHDGKFGKCHLGQDQEVGWGLKVKANWVWLEDSILQEIMLESRDRLAWPRTVEYLPSQSAKNPNPH